ncbi:MAG: hypothetical protein KDJ52_29805 [Anaerolineae bacterium]|nr:hypothetical protein [Anaerolineae bacterium]
MQQQHAQRNQQQRRLDDIAQVGWYPQRPADRLRPGIDQATIKSAASATPQALSVPKVAMMMPV